MNYALFSTAKDAKSKRFLPYGINMVLKNLQDMKKGGSYTSFKVLRIGRLLEGSGFYHEVNEHYTCIGLEVEIERQFDFQDKPETAVGFYSLWVGKHHECAPITFEESYLTFGMAWKFANGLGDEFTVTRELASVDEVQVIINNNHLL